ncbi:hypothetical protein GCM10010220_65500 [Streptomyces parvulus]|nr:hypothetical protein GCM10010220_65500 [Streptomyces parvulus]
MVPNRGSAASRCRVRGGALSYRSSRTGGAGGKGARWLADRPGAALDVSWVEPERASGVRCLSTPAEYGVHGLCDRLHVYTRAQAAARPEAPVGRWPFRSSPCASTPYG